MDKDKGNGRMIEYRAIYKCRLCGKEFLDSLINGKEVDECSKAFWKGKYIYRSVSGRNNIPKEKFHFCKDGSIGFADFLGFRKVDSGNEPD